MRHNAAPDANEKATTLSTNKAAIDDIKTSSIANSIVDANAAINGEASQAASKLIIETQQRPHPEIPVLSCMKDAHCRAGQT